jgi:hypothetical protein
MGLRKNSKHPSSVDDVLLTAQHKTEKPVVRGAIGAAAHNIEHVARDFLLQTMATGRPLRAVLGRQSQLGKARGHGEMELRRRGAVQGVGQRWKKGFGIQAVGAHGEGAGRRAQVKFHAS